MNSGKSGAIGMPPMTHSTGAPVDTASFPIESMPASGLESVAKPTGAGSAQKSRSLSALKP